MECNTCNGEIPEDAVVCPHCGAQAALELGRFARLKKIFSNRYDFIRLLGIGGFAEVYLALDKLLEREVAIKILLPQHGQDPQTVERFLREARLYAKLEHKNIIPIYDTGILEGHVFITMKYIRGESLKHVLFAQKRIAPGQLPGIISGIAQALAYIHRQGIVHR
ncbi:MAG: serine/threonine-protein kinase, partial [Candidatus Aminicenantes bacterium]|nr:serine/threonine-protein kinase [Candidatus Aminicenantes bacterium]